MRRGMHGACSHEIRKKFNNLIRPAPNALSMHELVPIESGNDELSIFLHLQTDLISYLILLFTY